ncbi:MAG: electron transporter RnfB, partial [Desulfatitalea sp.]|nr:electron transporter RnfB [Desulfatitalea sp.]NNK00718.1 electron transporter RnfB [Desulfatitalea sp.]
EQMGVKLETGQWVGRDFTVPELLTQGYQAVFLAVGGWDSRLARTSGQGDISPAPGCRLLIDLAKAGSNGYPEVKLNGHVIIVGNPNLSPQLITRCKAAGAERITLLVNDAAMRTIDVKQVDTRINVGISRLFGEENCLTGVELVDLTAQTTERMDANHLLFAAGRIPELVFAPLQTPSTVAENPSAAATTGWQAIAPYKQPAYHTETGLMANGDTLTDFSAAIKAIAAGRRAAVSVHKLLYDISLDLPDNVVTPDTTVQNVDHVERVPVRLRQIMPLAGDQETAMGQELEKGFTRDVAHAEAKRCLRCGLICYQRDIKAQVSLQKAPSKNQLAV